VKKNEQTVVVTTSPQYKSKQEIKDAPLPKQNILKKERNSVDKDKDKDKNKNENANANIDSLLFQETKSAILPNEVPLDRAQENVQKIKKKKHGYNNKNNNMKNNYC